MATIFFLVFPLAIENLNEILLNKKKKPTIAMKKKISFFPGHYQDICEMQE